MISYIIVGGHEDCSKFFMPIVHENVYKKWKGVTQQSKEKGR